MKSEKEKMLAGELYDPLDPELSADRLQARLLLKALNESSEDDAEERTRTLKKLLPNAGKGLWIQPPFFCDYGAHIIIGERVFLNFNCVVPKDIPSDVFAAGNPCRIIRQLDEEERR